MDSDLSYFGVSFAPEWTSQNVHLAVVLIWKHGLDEAVTLLLTEYGLPTTPEQVNALNRLFLLSGFNTPRRR